MFTVDVRGGTRIGPALRWVSAVRAGRFDAIIDLQSNDHTRGLLSLLRTTAPGVRHYVGYHRRYPYTIAPPPIRPAGHARDYYAAALAAAGIPVRCERPVLACTDRLRAETRARLKEHGLCANQYAVFLPGSQAEGYLKRWGARRYSELAADVQRRGLDRVVLLGGSEEREVWRKSPRRADPWS